jgi:hypothetical protein
MAISGHPCKRKSLSRFARESAGAYTSCSQALAKSWHMNVAAGIFEIAGGHIAIIPE